MCAVNFIQPLIELQEVDGIIRDLEREATDLPMRKAQESARLEGVNADLRIAKDQLAAAQKRIKEMEYEIEERRKKILEVRTSLVSIKSNKEYQQVTIQIDTLERENDEATARQLAAEDEIPTLQSRVDECQAKVDAERVGVDAFIAELDERIAQVNEELAIQQASRKEKIAEVEPKSKLYYERLRTKRWPVVVTLNNDGVCDGCHLVQPPSVAQMIQHNAGIVTCTMCGRILYRD
jgi:predicted  nucleic acid-binding Zn-ribbon protein